MPPIHRSCLFAALLLAGCASSEHNDLKDFVSRSEQGLSGRVGAIAEVADTFVRLHEHVEDGGQWTERVASLNLIQHTAIN